MNAFLKNFIKVYQQLKWLVWPFALLVITVLITRLVISRQDAYFFINELHTPAGDFLFPRITELGSVAAAVLISLLLLVINRRAGAMMATAYLFTAAISFTLKAMIGFPRPHRYFASRLQEIYFVPGVSVLDNFRSFPSGHSVCAFTAATVLSYYAKNKYWSLLYLALAMLVGYSRMYMSQHFLEDVTAGATLGVVFSMVWLSIFRGKTAQLSGQ
ncbi:phosphatase PAP2 family protein [Chitinophaga ginsengisegetis]|uniref:phosphatase PAP2 family protein n=1 Tax=Chitinophaga ginsengisegetis TaxID=393003 RepID=UPI000DBA8219|nr:phosphatase PAP2 family protein [Chitinophaga ginsengisegetis]MDR6567770.1 membrane-associated phospholipid phosphatase [Chitinophaga ginsengisegetis]MDR6647675.1 membrane-associated phospholipid phosphatase [Chitinophaga ginsengisegetis]MDR6654025.1 membrane-associated phospholipid phosphatase [Chitinophaga ginsengisegetis]